MMKRNFAISMQFILVFIVVILGTVPLVLMQTIVNRSVQKNILRNTTILTQGILDQSQKNLNFMLGELDAHFIEIMNNNKLKKMIDEEGMSENTLNYLLEIKKNSGIISSLILINVNSDQDSVLFSLNTLKYNLLDIETKKRFLGSQQAILLKENSSRILWLGTSPTGIYNAIPSFWTYRYFETKTSSYIIAGSLDRDKILTFLTSIGSSARSDVLLVSSDNTVYPYDSQFFNYPFAAEALSRSTQGRYNILYDTRKTPDGLEKLMIQVYSDPLYFYNLIILTPQRTLLRGFEDIVQTTTLTLLLLAIGSVSMGLLLIYIINKRIKTFLIAVYDIAKGEYNITLPSSRFQVQEDISLSNALIEMSQEIEKGRNILKYANENLEKNVNERTEELKKSLNELHMTRQSLIHSEKMAILGRQGAKIAHEMNNPLSVAITASSHLSTTVREINKHFEEEKLTKSDFNSLISTAGEVSDIILRNLKHASEMTRSFKNFASDQSREEKRKIKLKNYIYEIIKSFFYKIKRTQYKIELECDNELEIVTDPSIIYQTITNLINNSLLHGFENKEKGLITIKINEKENNLVIIFKDDGNGISKENLSQLYKPFFTTKADEGGTGLGLNIIKDLINDKLKGTIVCSSVLGEGTQFIISFPFKRSN